MASFLLLCSLLVVVNLYDSALHYSVRIEQQQLAGMLAERHLEQMRAWSELPNASGFNYDNLLTIYNPSSTSLDSFSLTTRVVEQAVYSSCSTLELGITPANQRRCILDSARKAQVTVSWDGGSRQVVLSSIFSRPCPQFRAANALVITGSSSGPIPKGGSATFNAIAYDTNNQVIPGLMLAWDIVPVDGNGTLTELRDGSVATLTNVVDVNGSSYYTGGSLYVQVRAKLHGQTSVANSTLITLAGP